MPTAEKTLWLSPKKAAKALGVTLNAVWGFEAAGLITAVAPRGRGVGRRVYFHRGDLEEFARSGICKRVRRSLEDCD